MTTNTKTQSLDFTASGTFVVPTGVTSVWLTMIGGGGGGGGQSSVNGPNGGGGGGAGEFCQRAMVKVTSGASITVTIGAGGIASTAGNFAGGDAGATSFGIYTCKGGFGGHPAANGGGGGGGGAGAVAQTPNSIRNGAEYTQTPAIGNFRYTGTLGKKSAPCWFGGGTGGCGGATSAATGGGDGAPCGGYFMSPVVINGAGGGGACTIFGVGGLPQGTGANGLAPASSTAYGTGGGGAGPSGGNVSGAAGKAGYVLVEWVAP